MKKLILFSCILSVCTLALASEKVVNVADFGAITDDGKNDSGAILEAVEHAREKGIPVVSFEAGTYDFSGIAGWDRDNAPENRFYMVLENLEGIELRGRVDSEGNPATKWLKHNDLKEGQPGILQVMRGKDLVLKNILVDMDPYYYSAGEVVKMDGNEVTVKVFEGHPMTDGQPAYIMGTYDLDTGKVKVVRITWDFDLPSWKISDREEGLMKIRHDKLARYVSTGEAVFWFQGNYTAPLIVFNGVEGLLVEDVHIWNGHGFPLQCNFNRDVTYRGVKLYPPGNRIATACRDGFKIFCTGGKVEMDGIHIEGCLGDDGQNIHGLWLTPKEVRGSHEMVVHYPVRDRPFPDLLTGGKVRLLDAGFQPAWESSVVSSEQLGGSHQLVRFEDPLPEWISDTTPVECTQWLPDTMIVKNSVFRNTGRYGILLKSSNTLIENCIFEYNTAAIRIGGEWHPLWLESMHSRNVVIRNCTFRDNHLTMLYGGRRMDNAINFGSYSMPGPGLIRNISIHDNTFINEGVCVEVRQVDGLRFWDNTLINCREDMLVEEESSLNIKRY